MLSKDKLEKISELSSLFKVAVQLVVFIGVCVSLCYFVDINYFPQGLTIGDTLFFIASSLAFATVYLLVVVFLFCGGFFISPFLSWIQSIGHSIFGFFSKKKVSKYKINFLKITWSLFIPAFAGFLSICLCVFLYSDDVLKGLEYTVYPSDFKMQDSERCHSVEFKENNAA